MVGGEAVGEETDAPAEERPERPVDLRGCLRRKSFLLLFNDAELFRVPPNFFQGCFELLEPV